MVHTGGKLVRGVYGELLAATGKDCLDNDRSSLSSSSTCSSPTCAGDKKRAYGRVQRVGFGVCSLRVFVARRGALLFLLVAVVLTSYLLTSQTIAVTPVGRIMLTFQSNVGYLINNGVPSSSSDAAMEAGMKKGFLIHTPGCVIPDFDPFHHTITKYIFNPEPIKCSRLPALTSASGTTLRYHHDALQQNLDHFLHHAKSADKRKPLPSYPSPSHPSPSSSSVSPAMASDNTTNGNADLTVENSKPSKASAQNYTIRDVSCCYKAVISHQRKPLKDNSKLRDGSYSISDECKRLTAPETKVDVEGVLVLCSVGDVTVYKNVHFFIQRSVIERIPEASANLSDPVDDSLPSVVFVAGHDSHTDTKATVKSSNTTARLGREFYQSNTSGNTNGQESEVKRTETSPRRVEGAEKLSVIIFGTDAVSHLNLRRHMPQTYEYLTQELGAIDLNGYNKVGDNTFPNLLAILASLTRPEVTEHPCFKKSRRFDACPFVWKEFKSNGYVTAFAEDAPWMGIFTYNKKGFLRQPTDYYNRAIFRCSEKEIGHYKKGNAKFCQGPKMSLKVIQDYSLEVARTFPNLPTFGLYWAASVTHDYLNLAHLADLPHLAYLKALKESGTLEHTALFFVSDHGMRWGGIRSTYIGMLEERLPYVVFYLPPWFRTKYQRAYQNLVTNSHRLTNNFDLHRTLQDIAWGRFADPDHVSASSDPGTRGRSLFQEMPLNRTCEQIGIPDNYCTCQDTREVTREEDPMLDVGADFLKASLVQDLAPHPQCVVFSQIQLLTARVSKSNSAVRPKDRKSDVKTYVLQALLHPGEVMVEATLRFNPKPGLFQVVGEVSRINAYGSTSSCIDDFVLRKFCFCKIYLKNLPQRNMTSI